MHSPTPWVATHHPDPWGDYWRLHSQDPKHEVPGAMTHDEALAAHIVRCVNAHDDLAKSLSEAIELLVGWHQIEGPIFVGTDGHCGVCDAVTRFRAALARAKGG